MWVPAHVPRTDVRLRVPRPAVVPKRWIRASVSFVDRLAVCRLSKPFRRPTASYHRSVAPGRGLGPATRWSSGRRCAQRCFHPLCQPTPSALRRGHRTGSCSGARRGRRPRPSGARRSSVRLQQRERRSGYVGRRVRHQRWERSISGGAGVPCQRHARGPRHHRGRVFKHGLEQRCLGPLHSVSASGDMKRMG